ncbi:MAG: hypothetical protein ACNFW9_06370 [Candidatus Kerfeldbacteria bacterium]
MAKTSKEIIKQRNILISQIKEYCPIIKPFFDLDVKLKDYSEYLYDFEVDPIHSQRQVVIKDKIINKLKSLFGNKFEKELNVNFENKLVFNIANHHQVMNHPFLVSANVIGNTDRLLQSKKQEAIIVLSSGDVPPNNYFSKNGFMLHGKKVPLFSNSEKELTSYYIPKREFDFINRLKKSDKWKEFNDQEHKFLLNEQEKINSFDFSQCQNYNDQISVIVKETWPYLFEEKLRKNLPDVLYVTQEEITTECLIDLLEEDNIISKCIFNKEFRNKVLQNFNDLVVTWNEKEQKGTHFFWQKYPGRNQSLRMYIKGNNLVPADVRFKNNIIPLTKDAIIGALKKREIYPSLFMIFGVLNFYAGIKPLVGYGSLLYLDLIKKGWLKTLEEFKMDEEIKLMEQVKTDGFTAGLAIFFKQFENKTRALYANDIFYENGIKEDYLKRVFEMSFGEVLSIGAADVYDYYSQKYIPKDKRIKAEINFDDLAEITLPWL